MKPRILIVDDDSSGLEATAEVLKREEYDLFTATGGRAAIEILDAENVDVVITDEKMPDMSGIELLKYIHTNHPYTQVILLTAYGTIDSAVEAIQTGAVSYREKPIRIELLRQTVKSALERRTLHLQNINLREQLDGKFGFANIIGTSKPMQELFDMIRRIAPTNVTALITGENGAGKELIAKAVHNHSRRKDRLFRDLNCGAIPRELVEGELFGHEKGAFTSATARRLGVFEQADGGTLFLDEIGEMTPETQVRFLRVLESQEFRRLGGDKNIQVDVRVIAASNKDLNAEVRNGAFREDLFHRINRFRLHVPPLRERREDIPLLASSFLREFSREHDLPVTGISPDAMNRLKYADWPGNVRQLRNAIETGVILSTTGAIQIWDLPPDIQAGPPALPPASHGPKDIVGRVGMTMDEIEKEAIRKTLADTGGNKTQAAKILKVGLRTLHRKVQTYGLEDDQDWKDGS